MQYPEIKSLDPKWSNVAVGQYAIVRLSNHGDIEFVYDVEGNRQLAIAFARSLNMSSGAVLFRVSEQVVEKIPWA